MYESPKSTVFPHYYKCEIIVLSSQPTNNFLLPAMGRKILKPILEQSNNGNNNIIIEEQFRFAKRKSMVSFNIVKINFNLHDVDDFQYFILNKCVIEHSFTKKISHLRVYTKNFI